MAVSATMEIEKKDGEDGRNANEKDTLIKALANMAVHLRAPNY